MLLSGILKIEDTVNERMKEAGMINVMENKVLAPLMLQQYEKGRDEGVQEGVQAVLVELLTERFGALPAWAVSRIDSAASEELHAWVKRVLHGTSLEDTLR